MGFQPLYIPSSTTSSTFALIPYAQPSPAVFSVSGEPITIAFGNVSISMPTSGSSTPVYVLPTTVYITGSTTQTYSEDQITSLSSITTTTSVTTTLTEKMTSGSQTVTSTIKVVLPVNSGGFYWSPVPEPTVPELPLPTPPDLPPIPDPHCFKFLDIFSTDCPPDKNQPSTHYTSGPSSPTCTANCGTMPNSNSDSQTTTTTSSCATETSTVCHTVCTATPCATICNEYVGCQCPTSTVTDYWVSCSSSSCTTTSSTVITGCYVTATATTTGNYCPSPIYDASLQDVGDAYPSGVTFVSATTTIPEYANIGGTAYPVNSGEVVVGGSTISIVTVSVVTVISLDGTPATIYPATTEVIPELSGLSALGITGSPIPIGGDTTTTPTTTSSTSTFTTSSGPPFPTNTDVYEGGTMCWSDYNTDGEYQSFTLDDAESVINAFCANNYVLAPGNTYGYVEEGGNNIYVSASWAEDQTGCGTEQDFDLSSIGCTDAWDLPLSICKVTSNEI